MPKISQLPILTNINTGSIIPIVDNSKTQKISVGKLYEFLSGTLDQTFSTEFELMQSASAITSSINTLSASFNQRINDVVIGEVSIPNGTISSSNQITALGFVTTGSNTFTQSQTISAGNSLLVNRIENTTGGNIEIAATGLLSLSGDGGGVTTNDNFEANPGGNATFKVISGSVIVTGSISATGTPIVSSSQQITNFGFATTSSVLNIDTSSLVTTSSFNTFTSSLNSTFATDLEVSVVSGAIATTTGILQNSFTTTSSFNSLTASVNTTTSSLNTFSASVNGKTGSFATTGSNTFIGNQTFVGTDFINLTLGQTYGGGKVFYLTSNYALIIDQSDLGTVGHFTLVNSASGSAIGTGEFNTLEIVNNTNVSETNSARLAYNSTNGGYSDWFLPSVDELVTAVQSGYANLNTAFYRTSTAGVSTYQSVRNDGYVSPGSYENHRVRAIRKVNLSSSASLSISGSLNVSNGITGSGINFSTSSHIKFVNDGFPYSTNNDIEIKAGNIRISSSFDNGNTGLHISGNTFITGFIQIGDITNDWNSYIQSYGDVNVFGTSNLYGGINSPTLNSYLETASFNTFSSSINTTTASLNTFSASVNGKTGSYATTGSNIFVGNQTITGSLTVSGSGSFIGNQRIIGSVVQGEGLGAGATGLYSYTHGYYVEARGEYSRAEGVTTLATGTGSHAEGSNGTAAGNMSHAEGNYGQANGAYSHAEGNNTQALGVGAHSEGNYTVAKGNFQHVQGQYNITSSAQSAFIIGNGTDFDNRSNLVFASGSQFQITGSLNVSGSLIVTGSGSLNGNTIVSSNTIQKIETISSASYAALTPVSGTLYIIIG